MLGIYNCPLIHFGDVVCLLDLIGEVNETRAAEGQPPIKAFDFFPKFETGMPFDGPRTATYGLSWDPLDLEVAQRGLYTILLKAFMKAQSLKLDVLFEEKAALRDFLAHIPNMPFGVPCFLDALYRLISIKEVEDADNERKQAIYDLRMPVRMHLNDKFKDDSHNWYHLQMAKDKYFCTSCGYEMLDDFFTYHGIIAPPDSRVCAGCFLQQFLDEERHHLLAEKKGCVDALFPNHDGRAFNMDVPVPKNGHVVLRLTTTKTKAPPAPMIQVQSDGKIHRPQYIRPFVRDHKRHGDGLHGLPTLQQLAEEGSAPLWRNFRRNCYQLDAFCFTVRLLVDQQRQRPEEMVISRIQDIYPLSRGKPDHWEERQKPRNEKYRESHTFATALQKHLEMVERGFQPGVGRGPGKAVDEIRMNLFKENKEKSFW